MIYAVCSGDYEDFGVHAVFESEADAEAHAALIEGGFVMSQAFYEAGTKPKRITVWHISAHRSDDQGGYKERESSRAMWDYEYSGPEAGHGTAPAGSSTHSSWAKYFNAWANGTDRDAVREAFQTELAAAQAEYAAL